jgi:hypothetical protein
VVYDGNSKRVAEAVGGVPITYLVDTVNPTGYAEMVDESLNCSVIRVRLLGWL